MIDSEWQEIDQTLVSNIPVQVSVHRVRSQSPFNLPRAFRTTVSPEGNTMKIEFRYIEDEPAKLKNLGRNVTVWIGKTSKRIRGIQVRGQSLTQSSRQNLDCAIDQLITDLSPAETQAKGNYQVVREVASAQFRSDVK